MNIILLGPPGAGKGTQADFISNKFGLPKVSTGDLFRDNIKNETELGNKANKYVNSGKLVPDTIVTDMIENWLFQNNKNWILDGFPRTINQAESLDKILNSNNQILNIVLLISVQNNILENRLIDRQSIENRSDDNIKTIKIRINTYEQETKPLISYYKKSGLLSEIDGSLSISEVSSNIKNKLVNIKNKINN
jgi:adenylate kinase